MRIAEGGVHLGDLFGEFGDVLVGGALGGERGDGGLDDEAGLEHLPGQEAVQRAEDGERAGVERGRAAGDEGAGAVAALEHAHGGEEADAGAQGGAADLELAGEFALGRQAVAGVQRSAGDEAAHVVDDLQGELAVAAWIFACLFLSCAVAFRRSRPSTLRAEVHQRFVRKGITLCLGCGLGSVLGFGMGWRDAEARHQELEDRERDQVGRGGDGEDEQRMQREVALDDPGEAGSADRAGGAADADDGGDGGGGEHVAGRGEEVRGPALVGGGGERDEQRRGPRIGGEESAHVRAPGPAAGPGRP